MTRDWVEWHRQYDAAGSSLARRLATVRDFLRRAVPVACTSPNEILRLVSMCAGDGRDVLPVLAENAFAGHIDAFLVELDGALAQRARDDAARLGLAGVQVLVADAGDPLVYSKRLPAQIVLACGVFGNVTAADTRRTIGFLPSLLAPGGIAIWTRGRNPDGSDQSAAIREWFKRDGFSELAFVAPPDATFRVGMVRFESTERNSRPTERRLFTFR